MNGLVHAHSGLRYLIVFGFIWVIFNYLTGSKKAYEGAVKRAYLITLIFLHLQMVLGFVLYFTSEKSALVFEDFGMAMGNDLTRFFGLEHILGMLIGVVLATIGYSKAKRMTDLVAAHKKAFLLYLIAFIVIFVSIPWPFLKVFGTWF